jgi:hypothetical protein
VLQGHNFAKSSIMIARTQAAAALAFVASRGCLAFVPASSKLVSEKDKTCNIERCCLAMHSCAWQCLCYVYSISTYESVLASAMALIASSLCGFCSSRCSSLIVCLTHYANRRTLQTAHPVQLAATVAAAALA